MSNFLFSFLVPFIVVMISFLIRGVMPFGELSLLSMDAWGQYFPMLCEMKEALKTGEVFWSFSGGLGFNLWVQNAYYTNSVLWILLYILPDSMMVAGVNVITAIRIGLAGLSFCYYLNRQECFKSCKKGSAAVIFTSAYALSGYVLAFINQFMWMDVVIILPLVVAGLDGIVTTGKIERRSCVIYVLALFYAIWSNFYVGYMVCLFSVVYFIGCIISVKRESGQAVRNIIGFGVCSCLAGGLAGVILVPVYMGLKRTIASGLGYTGKIELYHSFTDIMKKFLPLSAASHEYEAANVYCGLITLILCVLSFKYVRKSVRERACFIVAVVFFYASLNTNLLDYVWHGFHFPNQLPGRWSFVLVFLTVKEAYLCFNCIMADRESNLRMGILILLATELLINAGLSLIKDVRMIDGAGFNAYYLAVKECVTDSKNEDFFRMELCEPYNFNEGQLCGYNGISHYSSTMSEAEYNFFGRLGMPIYARNVSTRYQPEPGADALLGVKYLIEWKDGAYAIKENENYLSLAFIVDESEYEQFLDSMLLGNLSENEVAELISAKVTGELEINEYRNSRISGFITTEGGMLITTLPEEGGWEIYIDGEKQVIISLFDYLCGVRCDEGRHYIEMRYSVPGLDVGFAISILSFIIGIALFRKRSF